MGSPSGTPTAIFPGLGERTEQADFIEFFFDRGGTRKYHAPPMSDERLPVHIDPIRFAEIGRELKGRIALAEMERLSAMLLDNGGDVQAELSFGVDHEGIRFMRGRVSAVVKLQCQRCLGVLPQAIEAEMLLGFVSERDPRELPSYYEPLPVGHEPIFLRDIIEDELILSLPIVPKHAEGQCPKQPQAGTEDSKESHSASEANPFAVLAGLKRN